MKIRSIVALWLFVNLVSAQGNSSNTSACRYGHFTSPQNQCVQCPTTCPLCQNLVSSCNNCPESFYLNTTISQCVKCSKGFLFCTFGNRKCQRNYRQQNERCYPLCKVQNCRICKSITSDKCQQCRPDFNLNKQQNQCVRKQIKTSNNRNLQAQGSQTLQKILKKLPQGFLTKLGQSNSLPIKLTQGLTEQQLQILRRYNISGQSNLGINSQSGSSIFNSQGTGFSSNSQGSTTGDRSAERTVFSQTVRNNDVLTAEQIASNNLFGSLSGLSGSTLLNGGGDQFGSFSSNNLNAGLNNNINNNFGTGSNSQFSSFSSSGTGTATAPTSGIRTVRTQTVIQNITNNGISNTINNGLNAGLNSGISGLNTQINSLSPSSSGTTGSSGLNFQSTTTRTIQSSSNNLNNNLGGLTLDQAGLNSQTQFSSQQIGGQNSGSSNKKQYNFIYTTLSQSFIQSLPGIIGPLSDGQEIFYQLGDAKYIPNRNAINFIQSSVIGDTGTVRIPGPQVFRNTTIITTTTTTDGTTTGTTGGVISGITTGGSTTATGGATSGIISGSTSGGASGSTIANTGSSTSGTGIIQTTVTTINRTVLNNTSINNGQLPNVIIVPQPINPVVTPVITDNTQIIRENTTTTITTNTSNTNTIIVPPVTPTVTPVVIPPVITPVVAQIQCKGISQFFSKATGRCELCDKRCLTCINSKQQCLQCNEGYIEEGWKCVSNQSLLYNLSIALPQNQQQRQILLRGAGINKFKSSFISSLLPGYNANDLEIMTITDTIVDTQRGLLNISGVIDKSGSANLTQINKNIATKLNTGNVTVGSYNITQGSIKTSVEGVAANIKTQQEIVQPNVIPTAPKSDLNLVAILVPSILGGLCLLGLLSALLCYCLKICCFEKKPIFKDIPYDNNTARRFVNNQPINTAPPQPITSFVPIAPVTPKPNFPPIVVTPPANLNVQNRRIQAVPIIAPVPKIQTNLARENVTNIVQTTQTIKQNKGTMETISSPVAKNTVDQTRLMTESIYQAKPKRMLQNDYNTVTKVVNSYTTIPTSGNLDRYQTKYNNNASRVISSVENNINNNYVSRVNLEDKRVSNISQATANRIIQNTINTSNINQTAANRAIQNNINNLNSSNFNNYTTNRVIQRNINTTTNVLPVITLAEGQGYIGKAHSYRVNEYQTPVIDVNRSKNYITSNETIRYNTNNTNLNSNAYVIGGNSHYVTNEKLVNSRVISPQKKYVQVQEIKRQYEYSPQSNLNGRVGKVTEYKFDSDGKIHTRVISGGEFEKDINLQPGRSKVYQYVNNNQTVTKQWATDPKYLNQISGFTHNAEFVQRARKSRTQY